MIPRLLHQLWLNDGDPPQAVLDSVASWREHAPQFTHVLWRRAELESAFGSIGGDGLRVQAASNMLRVLILHAHGGVFVDADTFARAGAGEELAAACDTARLLAVTFGDPNLQVDNTPMGAEADLPRFRRLATNAQFLARTWNHYLAESALPVTVLSGRWWNARQPAEGVRVVHRRGSLREHLLQPAKGGD